jgi:integrase
LVPIAAPLLPVLSEAMAGTGEHDLLFPGLRGGYLNSKNLSRALHWHQIRDQVKTFPPGENPLHWHDLRHTAAVALFKAGVSAPDVQAILGHSSLQVTQLYADASGGSQAGCSGAVPVLGLPLEKSRRRG